MGCEKHFLNIHWDQHDWFRRVTATESHAAPQSDMWGRPILNQHVTCHIEYVCRTCGLTRTGEECGCDKAKADQCPARLAFLDARTEPVAAAS